MQLRYPLRTIPNTLKRLFEFLTAPDPSVEGFETRLKSRWMAAIMITVVPFGTLIACIPLLFEGRAPWQEPYVQATLVLVFFLGFSYNRSRWGQYRTAALIGVIMTSAGIYTVTLLDYSPANMLSDSYYLILVVMFSNFLLPQSATVALFFIHLIMLFGLAILVPAIALESILKGPIALLVTSFTLILYGGYLNRMIAKHHLSELQRENAERRDIEEKLRTSLQEKEILLKEIHHRVKNNLQIVSSLLNLQSSLVEDPEIVALFQDSQARVRSMALVHERLYRSTDLARVDFTAYLNDLTRNLLASFSAEERGIHLRTTGDRLLLDIEIAIPCGLLLNELLSNALKHAYPRGKHGTIALETTLQEGGQVLFAVRDDGIGFPPYVDFRNTASLGLQLVHSLALQLNGRVELRAEPHTEFRIEFSDPRIQRLS